MKPARDLELPPRERRRSPERENWLLDAALHGAWWTLVRAYLSICHRLEARGREYIPAGPPFVMVANHSSHLDVMTLGAVLPWRLRDCLFPLAAGDTFFERASVAAFATLALNALPVWRKNFDPRDMDALRRRLVEDPCVFVLFPEGTRTRDGTMARFKRGLGMLVAGTGVPVVPCRLAGTFEALPPHRAWPRLRPIKLAIGPPLTFSSVPNDKKGWGLVAEQAEDAVRGLSISPPESPLS